MVVPVLLLVTFGRPTGASVTLTNGWKLTLYVIDSVNRRNWTADGRGVSTYLLPRPTLSYLLLRATKGSIQRTFFARFDPPQACDNVNAFFSLTNVGDSRLALSWLGALDTSRPRSIPRGALWQTLFPASRSFADVGFSVAYGPWKKTGSYTVKSKAVSGYDFQPEIRQEYLNKRHVSEPGAPFDPDDGNTNCSVMARHGYPNNAIAVSAYDAKGSPIGLMATVNDSRPGKRIGFPGLARDIARLEFYVRPYTIARFTNVHLNPARPFP